MKLVEGSNVQCFPRVRNYISGRRLLASLHTPCALASYELEFY